MYYWQWTNRGFFSELSLFMYAKLLAEVQEELFVCDFSKSKLGEEHLTSYLNIFVKEIKMPILKNRSLYAKDNLKNKLVDRIISTYIIKEFLPHNKLFDIVWDVSFEGYLSKKHDVNFNDLCIFFKKNWLLSEEVLALYSHTIEKIGLETEYLAVHIRRGDKLEKEAEKISIKSYFENVDIIDFKQVFVATDDYLVVDEVKEHLAQYDIQVLTNAKEENVGHVQLEFNSQSNQGIKSDLNNLLVEAEIMRNSKIFIGSYTSNIGRYIHLLRDGVDSYSVDIPFTLYYNPYEDK